MDPIDIRVALVFAGDFGNTGPHRQPNVVGADYHVSLLQDPADNASRSSSEAPNEPSSSSKDTVLKLECNISVSTNFLLSGILDVSDHHGRI